MGPDAKRGGTASGFGPVGGAQHFLPKGLSQARTSRIDLGRAEQAEREARGLSSQIRCRLFIHLFIYFGKRGAWPPLQEI